MNNTLKVRARGYESHTQYMYLDESFFKLWWPLLHEGLNVRHVPTQGGTLLVMGSLEREDTIIICRSVNNQRCAHTGL